MERLDLKSDAGLKSACQEAEASHAKPEWRARLKRFLEEVRSASLEERASEAFQRRLWEENPVSGAGMGTVNVERAIADEGFRRWLAEESLRRLPDDPGERTAVLNALHKEALERLEPLCDRMPRLKLFRVLAAFFPAYFTTLADQGALKRLLIQLGSKGSVDPVIGHGKILDRLAEVLDPIDAGDLGAVVRRMKLPWQLTALVNASEPDATMVTEEPGEERLNPLPAARRRKGLTAIAGYLEDMLSLLDFVQDQPTREELIDYLRSQKPTLKDSSLRTQINIYRSEFNVLRLEGDRYTLTERGEALLESGDPDELRDWLLTRVLGIDHALLALKAGSRSREVLLHLIQVVNPNWTSNFIPSAIILWLLHLDLIVRDAEENYALTERGRAWCEWITWEPEGLKPTGPEVIEEVVAPPGPEAIQRPELAAILQHIEGAAAFPSALITSLHLGLWANERRHFAILTGLSGSGKTLLAREYGKALTGTGTGASKRLCTLPVQPGWYDPTPLLGYVNPLSRDTYEGTPFLNLLIHATERPQEPHVAILDEMNLSHPEQYLAPILSAMETGDVLELHSKGEHFDGVPVRIPYPSNLVLIGTVNMDETTLGLSDKVLDRAFTLEFWKIDVDRWPGWGKGGLEDEDEAAVRRVLSDLMGALEPARLHFGWRVIAEVVGFLELRQSEGGGMALSEALDRVVYAKVLPKLRGEDSQRFRDALAACAEVLESHHLTESLAKVAELKSDLETLGSARFWR